MQLPETVRHAQAQARADRIRTGLLAIAQFFDDVMDAYREQDWTALGYSSWQEYLDGEFGELRFPKLTREKRREVARLLTDNSLPTRAVAAVLGVNQATVVRDLADASASRTPEDWDRDAAKWREEARRLTDEAKVAYVELRKHLFILAATQGVQAALDLIDEWTFSEEIGIVFEPLRKELLKGK